ncbi:MAG: peptidoglycan-binding protein [Firmicutes bacterium]|nr:peptidoglycan-binding protein [Bacillota bacterium]
MATGTLRVQARTELGFFPVSGARVTIRPSGSDQILEEVITDESGNSPLVALEAPDVAYSLDPQTQVRPYSTYDITVESPEFQTVRIAGVQILAGQEAIQQTLALPRSEGFVSLPGGRSLIEIAPNTLWGDFPSKIPEDEVKSLPGFEEEGFVVLPSVVVPEFVIVHDGRPNEAAADYRVPYAEYIKNVASSEIYSTWPEATILANVLAIMSFTLNRVYTEWYPSKGYPFTITSSTAYDQKYVPGRNIFESISQAVDSVLTNYITRPDIVQPLLTQYCDGQRTTCPGWMTQWGAKELGDQGFDAVQILRYFYGYDIYLDTAERVEGVPESYPGTPIRFGDNGPNVAVIQRQLQRIRQNFPAIPGIAADGIFGRGTEEAVRKFQSIFNLTPDGIVGKGTWYRLSQIYTAVSGIAEL